MSILQDVEILKNIPLLRNVEPAKLKLLAFTSDHMVFGDGDTICAEGDAGDAAYILLEGKADVFVSTPEGPVRVASLSRNDIIGEIAILCDVPRTATVVADGEVKTLRIAKDGFFNLVTQFPTIGMEIMQELASRLHHTTQQLTQTSSKLRAMENS